MSDLTRYACGLYGRVPSDVGDFVDYDEAKEKISFLEQQLQQAEARLIEINNLVALRWGNNVPAHSEMLEQVEQLSKSGQSGAWLLRKQAEAVEECYQDMLSLPELLKFTAKEMAGFKCGLQHVKGEALTLRQQADEAENG